MSLLLKSAHAPGEGRLRVIYNSGLAGTKWPWEYNKLNWFSCCSNSDFHEVREGKCVTKRERKWSFVSETQISEC